MPHDKNCEGAMPDQTPDTSTQDTDTSDVVIDATSATTGSTLEESGKRALDAERKARREAEKVAKTTTAELDALRKQTMTEQDRAVAEAKDAGRAEALAELSAERVGDAVRLAAAGRNVDVEALLEGLDRSRFVNSDGPDREAIGKWVDRVAPAQTGPPGTIDLGQGVRSVQPLNGDGLEQSLKQALGIS